MRREKRLKHGRSRTTGEMNAALNLGDVKGIIKGGTHKDAHDEMREAL